MFFYIFLYFVSLVSIKWYLMALICIFSLSKAEHLLVCLWILCVWHYYSCFVLTNFSLMPKRKWLLFYSLQYNPLFSLVILMRELFLIQSVTSSCFFFVLFTSLLCSEHFSKEINKDQTSSNAFLRPSRLSCVFFPP